MQLPCVESSSYINSKGCLCRVQIPMWLLQTLPLLVGLLGTQQPAAIVDPTLGLRTRYQLRLGGPKQCRI